jgi:hypothetical protein
MRTNTESSDCLISWLGFFMPSPESTGQKTKSDDRYSWHKNSKNPKEPWPLKKQQILTLTITHARACGCFDNAARIETGINVDVVQVQQKERAITDNQGEQK